MSNNEEQDKDSLPANIIPGARTAMGYQPSQQERSKMQVSVNKKKKANVSGALEDANASKPPAKKKESVWEDGDFKAGDGLALKDEDDGRKQPDYDIMYVQDVGSEDVFLNLGRINWF